MADLPTSVAPGAPNHAALHNAVNAKVNEHSAALLSVASTAAVEDAQEAADAAQVVASAALADDGRRSWAVAAVAGRRPYRADRGAFNVTPSTMKRWIRAKARMQSGTGRAHISVIGDSTWYETTSQPASQYAAPGVLKAKLMEMLGVPSGGSGIVVPWMAHNEEHSAEPVVTWAPPVEPRLRYSRDAPTNGNVEFPTNGLFARGAVKITDNGDQTNHVIFQPGHAYDELWIYSIESGIFSYAIDLGSSLTTPVGGGYYKVLPASNSADPGAGEIRPLTGYQRDPSGAGGGQRVAKIPLTNGTHNFRLLDNSGDAPGSTFYLGFEARIANSGLSVSNLALKGQSLDGLLYNWADTNGILGPPIAADMVKADLMIIGLMLNDFQANVVPSTFKANLRTLVRRQRAAGPTGASSNGTGADGDVLIVCSAQPNYATWPPGGAPTYPLSDYYRAAYEIADEENVGLIDNAARWVDYSTSGALMYDAVHPNPAGEANNGGNLARVLAEI